MPIRDTEKNKNYQLKWFQNNKERLKPNIKKRRTDSRNLIDAYKEKLGCRCALCGVIDHPITFDFHHVDPNEKEYRVSSMAGYRWERIKKEIDKCILICAACHRKVHNVLVELI